MSESENNLSASSLTKLVTMNLGLPWFELAGEMWKIGRKVMRGLSNEGMYEVLNYESTLELHDRGGKKATFSKRKKVRYLQDHIIAYQDSAWGDGKILVNYLCTPGNPVDRYRCGHKTHILISLREIKNKGDIDEFNIRWDIHKGFLQQTGFWATGITNRTKRIKVQILFPKSRPPLRLSLVEVNRQRTHSLNKNAKKRLPDGRWLVNWEKQKPKLFEQYILNWEW